MYISLAGVHRKDEEPFLFAGGSRVAKFVKQDGSSMGVKEMKETDFKCVTLYECGNTKNVEKAEVGLIRSLNNENLGRLSCINEILGGGNCPAGAKT